jgi:hypothetical protein
MEEKTNILDVQPKRCRLRFHASDFDFMSTVLGREHDADCLMSLYGDPEAMDILLDEPLLSDVLVAMPQNQGVSSRFYLYVILRQAFLKAGLDDRDLTDYVAEMLTTYFHSPEMEKAVVRVNPMGYVFDEIKKIQRANEEDSFRLRLHIGNFILFLLGVHPERCALGRLAMSPPDFYFLERMGMSYIAKAGNDPLADSDDLVDVLSTLIDNFRTIRLAIYQLTEMNVFVREERLAHSRVATV